MAAVKTETVFRSLASTFGLIRRFMEPYFAQHGISVSQWAVLRVLHRAADEGRSELRMTELSERLIIRPPSVTGVVDRLQRLGLVVRAADPQDLRAKTIGLTQGGRDLIGRARDGHAQRVEAAMGGLSLNEQIQLHQLLDRLATHVRNIRQQEQGQEAGKIPAKP